MTYNEGLSLAKSIFPGNAVVETNYNYGKISGNIKYFNINGEALLKTCTCIILQYDGEALYIPYRLIYTPVRIYPARKDSKKTALILDDFRTIRNPTKEQFTTECYKLLKRVKKLKIKEKLNAIKEDFK